MEKIQKTPFHEQKQGLNKNRHTRNDVQRAKNSSFGNEFLMWKLIFHDNLCETEKN